MEENTETTIVSPIEKALAKENVTNKLKVYENNRKRTLFIK